MEHTITLEKLILASRGLGVIGNLKLPVGVSFTISKFMTDVQGVLDIYNTRRDEVLKELQGDDGKFLAEDGEKVFAERLAKIQKEEVTLTLPSLSIKDLGDATIEASVLMSVGWIFKD